MATFNQKCMGVMLLNFKSIVQYLDFESIKNLIEVFNLNETPCEYNELVISNNDEYSYLMDNLSHFNYLSIDLIDVQFYEFDKLYKNIHTLLILENDMSEIPSSLKEYNNLKDLCICSANLTKMSNIETLTNMVSLKLVINKIEKIDNLINLTNITYLDLGYNKITKIENLESCVNVVYLSLAHNFIEKIENIGALVKLRTLILFRNKISIMENMENLKNLEYIDLSFNFIQVIEQLQYLPKLASLLLMQNRILNVDIIKHYPDINFYMRNTFALNFQSHQRYLTTINDFIPQKYRRVNNYDSMAVRLF